MSTGELRSPIFLIGNVRSGTTMMMSCFGMHPDVCTWFEPRTLWVYADPSRRHDVFDESDATPRVKRYIRKRFTAYQRAHGGNRVMEKTPSNVMRIPYVHSIFPEARYVYILREPFAQLGSSEIRWQKPIQLGWALHRLRETPKSQLHHYAARFVGDHFKKRVLKKKYATVWGVRYPGIYDDVGRMPIEQIIAKQWVACSRQADEHIARLPEGTVMRVKYEDVVDNPVETFTRVLEHVGLDMREEIAKQIESFVEKGKGKKWKRIDPEALRGCLPILRPEMERMGYEVPTEVEDVLAGRAETLEPKVESDEKAGSA